MTRPAAPREKMAAALGIACDLFISGKTMSLIQAINRAAAETGIDAREVRDTVKRYIRDGENWRHDAIKRAATAWAGDA